MSVTVEAVQGALKSLLDPNTKIDFVTAKNLKNLRVEDGDVSLDIVSVSYTHLTLPTIYSV